MRRVFGSPAATAAAGGEELAGLVSCIGRQWGQKGPFWRKVFELLKGFLGFMRGYGVLTHSHI